MQKEYVIIPAKGLCYLLAIIFMVAFSTYGQQSAGKVTGTVATKEGNVLAFATV